MKNKLIFTVCFILLCAVSVSTQAATSTCNASLKRSITKTTVVTPAEYNLIMTVLRQEGITASTWPNGVAQLQKKYNLQVTSAVGPQTRAKINELHKKYCSATTITASSTPSATSTATSTIVPAVSLVYPSEPYRIELLGPEAGNNFEQGNGREFFMTWTSKNMKPTDDVVVELLGENYDSVIRTWKTKNTGRFTLNSSELDELPIGYFNIRVRYFCNSDTIPCAEDETSGAFSIYPKTGYVAGLLHIATKLSGKVFDLNESSNIPILWYTYTGPTEYYAVYLGNVVLGKEVFVKNTQQGGAGISYTDVKLLKKDMTKSEDQIKNAYYVKVKAMKRSPNNDKEIVLKETTSGQFGIRK